MKLFKKLTLVFVGIIIVLAVGVTVNKNSNTQAAKYQSRVAKVNKQVISKNIQGTWYFYDVAGRKHVMIITGNTFKLDNKKVNTVGKGNFAYYYYDGIYQLGFQYSDNGYSFRTKTQKVNGRYVKTLLMISANYTGTRVMTQNHSYRFGTQNFF